MPPLTCHELGMRRGGRTILRDVSLSFSGPGLTAILGPNGAGKSTLARLLTGLDAPDAGRVELDGAAIGGLAPSVRARSIAYLPQERPLAWPMRVRDIVALGRFAWGGRPSALGDGDRDAVDHALALCALTASAERDATTLSGGEAARMHLARLLASGAPILVADEPTASLDPYHQHKALGIIRQAARTGTRALVIVHDLSLAMQYADRVILMQEGRVVADGTPAETLRPPMIRSVYGVQASLVGDAVVTRPDS